MAEAVADPRTPPEHRKLLEEVRYIKAYARKRGLNVDDNYNDYVALERDYLVWFVNASHPLKFEPVVFSFPVVGSFPGLGWFEKSAAVAFQEELSEEGWDANVRGVRAFSTAGWFSDPVVSSMFTDKEQALSYLVNVILHESVHATVLLKDQQFFNESLASYVADTMTPDYLTQRFGSDSQEVANYREREKRFEKDKQLLIATYARLQTLYESTLSDEQKLQEKARFMRTLKTHFEMPEMPNNATLIGVQLYSVGKAEFARLFAACGGSWPRFLEATRSAYPELFERPQREDFTRVLRTLARAGCEELRRPRRSRYRMH